MTDSLRAPLLVLDRATKSFGAVTALDDGSITLYAGEAHALLGENGAGKSTLVKILAGVHQPGRRRRCSSTASRSSWPRPDARAAGISIIYQEPTLFPDLTVAENIFMGRQPLARGRRIDRGADARRGRARSSPASASRSTRRARPAGCPSPTSRSSRSPRRSRSTPGCS